MRLRGEFAAHLGWMAVAGAVGLGLAVRPSMTVGLVFGALLLAVLTVVPIRFFPVAILFGTVALPPILLESRIREISLTSTPLAGQGRLLLVFTAVCLGRLVLNRTSIDLPAFESGAVGAYLIGLLLSTAVASFQGNWYAGVGSDLARQLSYPLAFTVGALASRTASGRLNRFSLYRSFACIGVTACSLSALFWLWEKRHLPFRLPFLSTIFEHAQAVSVYASGRSTFPFIDDSPNLAAIAFVLLGAFTVPVLLMSESKRDNRMGLLLGVAVAVGVLSTGSRTGLVTLAAAGLPLLLALRAGVRFRRAAFTIGVLFGIVFAGYHLFPQGQTLTTQAPTYLVRKQIWHEAAPKFLNAPIFGQGYHFSARPNFISTRPHPAVAGGESGRLDSIHSDYLGALVDGGIVGGSIFAVLLATFARTALRCVRSKVKVIRSEGIAFLCVLSGLAVAMYAAAVFQSAVVTIMIWLFFGIVAERRDLADRHRSLA